MPDVSSPDSHLLGSGFEELASLIADAYKENEEALANVLGESFESNRIDVSRNRIYDYLVELQRKEGTISIDEFLRNLHVVDQIMEQLLIADETLFDVVYDKRVSEILRRLGIAEGRSPVGIYKTFEEIFQIEQDIRRSNNLDDVVGKGVRACKRFERILKILVKFYGEFCFESLFKVYKQEKVSYSEAGLKDFTEIVKSRLNFLIQDETLCRQMKTNLCSFIMKKMSSELGGLNNLLYSLDSYTANLHKFQDDFERASVFSLREQTSIVDGDEARSKRVRQSIRERVEILLKCIQNIRNDLPHDEDGKTDSHGIPIADKFSSASGVRTHLGGVFDSMREFAQIGEQLNLFPISARLIDKCEQLNVGYILGFLTEHNTRLFVPFSSLASFRLGEEYYCWLREDAGFKKKAIIISKT